MSLELDCRWYTFADAPAGSYACLWSKDGTMQSAAIAWMPMARGQIPAHARVGMVLPIPELRTSAVREESKITGITAAELVADYLKLRCNSCDEGDAANIIHLLYENGVRFAHPENCLTPAVAAGALREALAEYARDLRRNSSGGDDYPWEIMRGVADYLDALLQRHPTTALAQAQEPLRSNAAKHSTRKSSPPASRGSEHG